MMDDVGGIGRTEFAILRHSGQDNSFPGDRKVKPKEPVQFQFHIVYHVKSW